ncbi:GIY-YIG nuclease family protein [Desulfurococcus mucosus]|uniref:GIY-YIG nuclease family protein n=1 Tax=Desulfurococcus mucosus TaxID=2275 RepID=UPI001FE01E23|nr:GIY-YIG nuclease family protein [Desulfurococcus mucosus]
MERSQRCSLIGLGEYVKSCYVLALEIPEGMVVEAVAGGRRLRLGPAVYFYIGSARGPCGVPCRVARHLAAVKAVRWHVDALTTNPVVVKHGFFMVRDTGGDCEAAVSRLLRGVLEPVKGFGCSDKPGDVSHLYACSGGVSECLPLVYSLLEDGGFNPIWVQAWMPWDA